MESRLKTCDGTFGQHLGNPAKIYRNPFVHWKNESLGKWKKLVTVDWWNMIWNAARWNIKCNLGWLGGLTLVLLPVVVWDFANEKWNSILRKNQQFSHKILTFNNALLIFIKLSKKKSNIFNHDLKNPLNKTN